MVIHFINANLFHSYRFSKWKSFPPIEPLSQDQIRLSLKNISSLHAKFWKDQKIIEDYEPAESEHDFRSGKYSKVRKNINKYFTKVTQGKWKTHGAKRLPRGSVVPSWMTIEASGKGFITDLQVCYRIHPADDGRYDPLDDPMVQEMFRVMSERYPKFYELKAKEWVKRPPETIVHGDFHSGNNMFGIDENEGEVIENR